MIEKVLSGILDTDSSNETLHPSFAKAANNVIFKNGKYEGVVGNTLVSNSLLPTGTNTNIFDHYDNKKNRIFQFNYNSNGNHGIYIYDISAGTHSRLIEVGDDTDGDILGFDLTTPIHSCGIIYGDSVDGDLLMYLDTLKRPTVINIDKFLNSPYTLTKRAFINLAKAPPVMPPQCTYENDDDVTINNLRNSLFQFAYAYKFDNNDETVLSQGSIVPLPLNVFDDEAAVSKNARIGVYLSTGDDDVKAIKLYVRQTKDGITSGWQLVETIDKTEKSISDNSIYRYVFYNDGLYTAADPKYATLPQDFIPKKIKAFELLNGNTPVVSGTTEGMSLPAPSVSASVSTATLPYKVFNGLLFFAASNGLKSGGVGTSITLYLSGTGTNTSGDVSTLDNAQAIFKVQAKADTDISFLYDNTSASATVDSIFDGLSAAAVTAGWTEDSRDSNSMTLTYSSDAILFWSGVVRSADAAFSDNDASFVYPHESNQSFGLEYIDDEGRISAVVTDIPYNIKTPAYGDNPPTIQLNISHRPPLDAVAYNIVRTKNLTYNKRLFWVSYAAYEGITSVTEERYAYIDIQNLYTYNEEIKSTSGVVGYTFSAGDRIRFLSRRKFDGTKVALSGKDYEIIGQVSSITLTDSSKKTGQFLQIKYPSNDISADFAFDGAFEFMNYEVMIYNYAKHADEEDTAYFEFSEQFGIGNAGTAAAYHIGSEQTQTANLDTDAHIVLSAGDFFFKKRKVPCGMSYQFSMPGYTNGWNQYTTVPINLTSTVTTSAYTITTQTFANAGLAASEFPTSTDGCLFENTSSSTVRIRIRFTYSFMNNVPMSNFAMYAKLVNNPIPMAGAITVPLHPLTGHLDPNIQHDIDIDRTIDVPAGSKLSIINYRTDSEIVVSNSDVLFDVLVDTTINAIEDSLLDTYALKTSANSKGNVIDKYAKETDYGTRIRWGLAYNQGTNINEINRFYDQNIDEADRSKGDVERLVVDGRLLYVYHQRGVGSKGIYATFIRDNKGTNTLTTTDQILTPDNFHYLQGEYGVGNHPEGLVIGVGAHYFVDPVRGKQIRRAGDGLDAINDEFHGQYYIGGLLSKYNKTWTNSGKTAKILGCFDTTNIDYICVLQGGTSGSDTINSYTFGFNEKRKGYSSFFDFHPEFIICAEDKIYTWLAGQLYIHNNTTEYAKFYGTQYKPSVTIVFNEQVDIKKVFKNLSYQSNVVWVSDTNGDINTSTINEQTDLQQISQLKDVDYDSVGTKRYAAFLCDANSNSDAAEGLNNGDVLNGTWISIKLTYNGTGYAWLFMPSMNYKPDSRL